MSKNTLLHLEIRVIKKMRVSNDDDNDTDIYNKEKNYFEMISKSPVRCAVPFDVPVDEGLISRSVKVIYPSSRALQDGHPLRHSQWTVTIL